MKKRCANCRFTDIEVIDMPCAVCTHIGDGDKNYWQPAEPARPKRKELEAQLADWKREYNYQQQRACDAEVMLADREAKLSDWKRWHANRDEELKVANAEMESMHSELDAKQAIIDEQEKGADDDHEIIMQISALNENLRKQRQEARRWAIKFRGEVLKLREWGKKDKAIIALLEKERDEARRELGVAKRTNTYTYILPAEARRFARYWYAAALEARAECTALAEIMIAAQCPFCGKSHLIDLSSGVEDEYICRDVRFGDFA